MYTRRLRSATDQAAEAARDAAETLSERSRDISRSTSAYVAKHPYASLGIALAVGALSTLAVSMSMRSRNY